MVKAVPSPREPLAPRTQQPPPLPPQQLATPRSSMITPRGGAAPRASGVSARRGTNTPTRRTSSAPTTSSTPASKPETRGFGMSTPRFDARYDASAKAQRAHVREERDMAHSYHGSEAHVHSAARNRGLHAAYAQCAALRRMLTALRVNRLLMRWRVAVVYISANERLAHSKDTRLAMEDAVVEVHKRGEVTAQRAALVASQRVYLSAMLPMLLGTPRLTRAFASWQESCRLVDAHRALLQQTALRRWQAATGEALREALAKKEREVLHVRKLTQKPTQLEREIRCVVHLPRIARASPAPTMSFDGLR